MAKKENLTIYEAFRKVPDEAKKEIKGGKLKGFTDINPMWRIKALTERFGPAGIGWYIDNVEKWVENGIVDKVCFVKINLYIKVDGEWSKPIVGVGGSRLESYVNGKNGAEGYYDLNDEAYKMAYTDAISIACKALGMAADIYYQKDMKSSENRTKYDMDYTPAPAPAPSQQMRVSDPTNYGVQSAQRDPFEPLPYEPMSPDRYGQYVAAEARGELTKTGRTMKAVWASATHAGQDQLDKFDYDVDQYKRANGIF